MSNQKAFSFPLLQAFIIQYTYIYNINLYKYRLFYIEILNYPLIFVGLNYLCTQKINT